MDGFLQDTEEPTTRKSMWERVVRKKRERGRRRGKMDDKKKPHLEAILTQLIVCFKPFIMQVLNQQWYDGFVFQEFAQPVPNRAANFERGKE